jgi:hypothetical protein
MTSARTLITTATVWLIPNILHPKPRPWRRPSCQDFGLSSTATENALLHLQQHTPQLLFPAHRCLFFLPPELNLVVLQWSYRGWGFIAVARTYVTMAAPMMRTHASTHPLRHDLHALSSRTCRALTRATQPSRAARPGPPLLNHLAHVRGDTVFFLGDTRRASSPPVTHGTTGAHTHAGRHRAHTGFRFHSRHMAPLRPPWPCSTSTPPSHAAPPRPLRPYAGPPRPPHSPHKRRHITPPPRLPCSSRTDHAPWPRTMRL